MKSVYYWSPYLTNVATINAVLNSAKSLKKYSKFYEPIIINSCGEFDIYSEDLKKNNIKILKLLPFNIHKFLPSNGFLLSRISYIIIFFFTFFPLLNFLYFKKPNYIILHLITSLPIIISNIIKKDTRYILRISGLPKYNFLRKYIWKNLGKNIFKVTCPTKGTMEDLKLLKIFDEKKLFLLKDPIIKISEILKKRREKINQIFTDKDYKMISIGRLTTQKNFKLIVNSFEEFLKINQNCKLIIIGDGEQKFFLNNLIKKKNLNEKIFLLGFKKNIFSYLSKADLFILPSLWEDPGWVLIEAGACGTLILSSDCKNGPSEFIHKDNGGLLFENNSSDDLIKKFKQINDLDNNQLLYKKIFAKKNAKEFTIFKHYNNLTKILN